MAQKPRYFIVLELVVVFQQFFDFSAYLKIPYILFIFSFFLLIISFGVILNLDPIMRFRRQLTSKSFKFLDFILYLVLQNLHDFFHSFINLRDFNKFLFFIIHLNSVFFSLICQQINPGLVNFDILTYCLILQMIYDFYLDSSFVDFIIAIGKFQNYFNYFMTKHLYF